jgi:hypothetical protein
MSSSSLIDIDIDRVSTVLRLPTLHGEDQYLERIDLPVFIPYVDSSEARIPHTYAF